MSSAHNIAGSNMPKWPPKLLFFQRMSSVNGIKKEKKIRRPRLQPVGLSSFVRRDVRLVDGTPLVGPTLKGLFGKTVAVITDGKERQVVADDTYLRKSLLEPNADVVKGFPPVMPPEKMADEELAALVDYIKSLK
jgi:hypothetical protein